MADVAKAFPEVGGTNLDGSGECYISSLRSYVSSVVESDNAIVIAKVLLCSALCVQQLPPSTLPKLTFSLLGSPAGAIFDSGGRLLVSRRGYRVHIGWFAVYDFAD